jgi:RNA polymerase sigma-70 factor (ECF subfamily)
MARAPVNGAAGGGASSRAAETLIAAARGGCARSLGELARRYRKYLLHVANESLSPALKAKVGASDLVQETLLNLHEKFERFEGTSEEELLNWLRRILYLRALQVARRYGGTAARDVRREISLYEAASSIRMAPLVDPAPTPQGSFLAKERLANLGAAIAALDDDARELIRLRSLERRSFAEIGALLGCSAEAARSRWVRAVDKLRIPLADED